MLVPRNVPSFGPTTIRSIEIAVSRFLSRETNLRLEKADLVQDIVLHVLERVDSYDPDRGAWSTFVKCLVNRKLSSVRRSETSPRGRSQAAMNSTLQEQGQAYGVSVNESSMAMESACSPLKSLCMVRNETEVFEQREDVSTIVADLSVSDQAFCQELQSTSIRVIAQNLNVTERRITKRRETIQQHFESFGYSSRRREA